MLAHLPVEKVIGREIIDPRGNPAVEAEVTLSDGSVGRGIAPSGASTGEFEVIELRGGDKSRFGGKGVREAVENINTTINGMLHGSDPQNIYAVDAVVLMTDGTENKSKFGTNVILAVSAISAKTVAESFGIPLYHFLDGINGNNLPMPVMNVLDSDVHATNSVGTREFMIMPADASNFSKGLRWCVEVFHNLQKVLKSEGNTTTVGDEGGFALNLKAVSYIRLRAHET